MFIQRYVNITLQNFLKIQWEFEYNKSISCRNDFQTVASITILFELYDKGTILYLIWQVK